MKSPITRMNTSIKALALGLSLCSTATAASYTFDLDQYDSATGVNGSYAQSFQYSTGGVDMTMKGYTSNSDGSGVRSSEVGYFSGYGFGVERSSGNQHTLDNNGGYDFMAFSFVDAVILDAVTSGWHTQDSDISILARTGTFNSSSWDGSWNSLTSNGFTHVGDYLNLIDDRSTAVNGSEIGSNFWLVGAYNPNLDASTSYTAGNDYLKLTEISVSNIPTAPTTPSLGAVPAPAPASLGLIAAVLAGLGIRRKLKR